MEKVVNSMGIKMTTAVSDTFKVVATPSQELLLELSNLAAKGNDAVNLVHKKPAESETKKEDDRNDIVLNVLQQISEQERVYQEYRKQSQQINNAIELALAKASTHEERQEILDYQNFVGQIDEDIEQKREDGILTQGHLNRAEQAKHNAMPDAVQRQLPKNTNSTVFDDTELSNLDTQSSTSFALNVDDSSSSSLSDMNLSFKAAASDQAISKSETTEPINVSHIPSDLSKFTM